MSNDEWVDDKEDLESIVAFSKKFELFKTREEEFTATIEYYDIKHKYIPWAIKWNLPVGVINLLAQRHRQLESELLNRNWKLIISIARKPKYQNKGLPLYDRVMCGWDGFMYGLKNKYNPHLGFKLGTYCTSWIHQRIQRAIGKFGGTIKIPGNVQDIMSKISVVTQEHMDDPSTEGRPTAQQISDRILVKYNKLYPAEKIAEYGRLKWDLVSLNESASNDESSNLSVIDYLQAPESYQPEVDYEEIDRRERLSLLLDGLEENERLVLIYKFGMYDYLERGYREIAKLLGMKQAQVKELEASGLLKLREKGDELLDYIS